MSLAYRLLVVLLCCATAFALILEQNIPNRHVVAFHAAEKVPHPWVNLHRAQSDALVSFTVLLKQRNLDLVEKTLFAVSDPKSANYGKYLSLVDVHQMTAPSEETFSRVYKWIKAHQSAGIRGTSAHGDFIRISATVAAVESMFETKLHLFRNQKHNVHFIRHLGALSIPSELADDIDFVAGLSEFIYDTKFKPVSASSSNRTRQSAANDIEVVPEVLRSYYKVPSTAVATNPKSLNAVIAFQDRYSIGALKEFDKKFSIKSSVVKNIGPDCLADGCDETESDLDVQYMTSLGANVPIWFWNHDADVWVLGYLLTVSATSNVPFIHSISYGWGEAFQCDDGVGGKECSRFGYDSIKYVLRSDTEFAKAGLRGVTFFVSSGDDGASGSQGKCNNGGSFPDLAPEYPTSSPYVTSVGATQFIGSGGSLHEVVCSINTNALITSGGGFNVFQPQPFWQKTAVDAYLKNNAAHLPDKKYFNATNRGYPDISLNGHNYVIYGSDNNADTCPCSTNNVDGTSCSSPASAGLFSLINDALFNANKSPLGFLNPTLYQMAAEHPAAFFDITVGDNKCTSQSCCGIGFNAAKGWDPASGIGTINFQEAKTYILSLKN